jgi:aromatic ring-opening dioxygenase LigB subunit
LKQTIAHPLAVFSALLLYFSHSKNICNLTICRSNDTKIAQFASGMRKILDNIQ